MATTRATILLSAVLVVALFQPAISGWRQTFSDEFNSGTKLNSSVWIPAWYYTPDSPSNELQSNRPDAFSFSATSLGIRAWSDGNQGQGPYYSGVISTKDRYNQLFGYFEFQAKLPVAKGVMASFGIFLQDTAGFSNIITQGGIVKNNGLSINVVLSNPSKVYFTQQCGGSTIQTMATIANLTDANMHKFGIDQLLNATYFYIDDQVVANTKNCIAGSPVYIASSLIVGGPLAGSPDASTRFPVTMDVDYIRAYKVANMGGVDLPGPGAGVFVNPLINSTPVVTIKNPSLSMETARLFDTVTFNFTLSGGGDLGSPGTLSLDQVNIAVWYAPITNAKLNLASSILSNVTLAMKSSATFSVDSKLLVFTPGYYSVALKIQNTTGFSILNLNTVHILQVLPSDTPSTPPVKPPVLPPVSPPVSTSVISNVIPILDCYSPINTTHYRAYFSINNTNSVAVSLPVGDHNKFTPGSLSRGQPTVFSTGRSALFPESIFVVDIDSNVAWVLSSYTLNVDISDASSLCPNSVTIIISVSSSSSLNNTKINELKDVIATQLNVTSDRVSINVACTTSASCDISVTISANPGQLSSVIQKAKDYTSDPETVENNVKQVSPDLSVTTVRGRGSDSEKIGSVNTQASPTTVDLSSSAMLLVSWPWIFSALLFV